MPNIKCTTCGDTFDSRETMSCRACGYVSCGNCATKNNSACGYCFGDMSYLN